MKSVLKSPTGVLAAVILGASLFVISCDSDKPKGASDSDLPPVNNASRDNPELKPSLNQLINISPANATITRIGQAVEFNALSGEYPMTWRLSNSSAGTLTVVGFSQAVYTSITLANNEVIVTDGIGHQGVATVNGVAFSVFPTTILVEASTNGGTLGGSTFTLTTRSGTSPFTWTLASGSLGALTPAGATATYVSANVEGTGSIFVTDANGQQATVGITQNFTDN